MLHGIIPIKPFLCPIDFIRIGHYAVFSEIDEFKNFKPDPVWEMYLSLYLSDGCSKGF